MDFRTNFIPNLHYRLLSKKIEAKNRKKKSKEMNFMVEMLKLFAN